MVGVGQLSLRPERTARDSETTKDFRTMELDLIERHDEHWDTEW